jgi:predicted RNA-binding Zn-ribbon protein involved in translation (DUF1610 family)
MSENTHDLLVYGVAAAKSREKDEARFYLEWALRTDADVDQEAEAWYWLSTVADDPNEKHNYLENVLAAYPNHPEARRDMAILEGRLKLGDIRDSLEEDAPLAPLPTLDPGDVQRFPCPNCGGKMAFDAMRAGLYCQFCGHAVTPGKQPAVGNQDWIAAIYTQKGHKWELPSQRTLSCQGCGATVTLLPSHVSTECPFCGLPLVVASQESLDIIQPVGVVPFVFDATVALAHARRFLEDQRFRPSDLEQDAALHPARPVYLPFWTFDISGTVVAKGFYPETQFRHVEMVPTEHLLGSVYEEVLVPGTKSLPDDLLSDLRYDTSALVPYSANLLADWPAEIYSVSLSDAAVVAHARVHQRSDFGVHPGLLNELSESLMDMHVDMTNMAILAYKLVLLPVWVTAFTYNARQYSLIVNGQDGKVHGHVPRSGIQRFLGEVFGEE